MKHLRINEVLRKLLMHNSPLSKRRRPQLINEMLLICQSMWRSKTFKMKLHHRLEPVVPKTALRKLERLMKRGLHQQFSTNQRTTIRFYEDPSSTAS